MRSGVPIIITIFSVDKVDFPGIEVAKKFYAYNVTILMTKQYLSIIIKILYFYKDPSQLARIFGS